MIVFIQNLKLIYQKFDIKALRYMGVGSEGPVFLMGFQHDTDKAKGGLLVLFFGLVFSVGPLPHENFSANAVA